MKQPPPPTQARSGGAGTPVSTSPPLKPEEGTNLLNSIIQIFSYQSTMLQFVHFIIISQILSIVP